MTEMLYECSVRWTTLSFPLLTTIFPPLEIEIRHNSGDLLPFERGEFTYYEGVSFQKGYGLRRNFSSIALRAAFAVVKGEKAVGKEALRTERGLHQTTYSFKEKILVVVNLDSSSQLDTLVAFISGNCDFSSWISTDVIMEGFEDFLFPVF
ncbi:hypothetical protein TNCV_5000501 [Trichonephila clavipes]|nr:hypothetical protein TNCV_5000501 [Trichonephila clavipes]